MDSEWRDFVFRLKKNTTYEVAEEDLKEYTGNVLRDETIFLRGSQDKDPERLDPPFAKPPELEIFQAEFAFQVWPDAMYGNYFF